MSLCLDVGELDELVEHVQMALEILKTHSEDVQRYVNEDNQAPSSQYSALDSLRDLHENLRVCVDKVLASDDHGHIRGLYI